MSNKLLSTVAYAVIAVLVPVLTTGTVAAAAESTAPDGASGPGPQDAAPTATPIKHLVVIFNENVSFDHYFATYPKATNPPGEPAFTAKPGTPKVDNLANAHLLTNNPNFTNKANGSDAAEPFRLDRSQAFTADQNHAYTAEQQAYNGGKADLFPKFTGKATSGGAGAFGTKGQVMGYYDGNTVAAMWNYAQHFAMSDNAFGDTYGPSTPGMLNITSGQTNGMTIVATTKKPSTVAAVSYYINDGAGGLTMINDVDPGYDICSNPNDQAMMSGKTIGDLLNGAGITWGSFMGGFRLDTANANGSTGCKRSTHSIVVGSDVVDYIPHHAWFQYYASTANPKHERPSSLAAIGYSLEHDGTTRDPANHNYDLTDFYDAVKAGNFPVGVLYQDAGLPGRSCGLFGSARRAGRHGDAYEFSRTAAGLEKHCRDHDLGRFRRLVRSRLRESDESVLRRRSGPTRWPGQVRRGCGAAWRRRQAGERPLRSRHADPFPCDFAVVEVQLCRPRADFVFLRGALHRG